MNIINYVNSGRIKPVYVFCSIFAYCLLLFTLSSIPGDKYPEIDIPNIDKSVHIVLYFPLGLMAGLLGIVNNRVKIQDLSLVSSLLFLFAASDEIHQLFVRNRTCDIVDFIFDVTGILIGIFLVRVVFLKKQYLD